MLGPIEGGKAGGCRGWSAGCGAAVEWFGGEQVVVEGELANRTSILIYKLIKLDMITNCVQFAWKNGSA